jgi:quinol monooxygenase YgiN
MNRILGFCVLVGLVVLLAPTTRAADDKPHPVVVDVKSKLKDPKKPFTMLVRLKVKEGSEEKFEKAFAKAREGTLKEKGNKAYDLARNTKTPNEYIVYERWVDLEALDTHIKTKYITTLLAELNDLLVGPPELQVFVPVE